MDHRWTTERQIIHREIVDDLYERAAAVPCDHQAVGLGGAGASGVLEDFTGTDRSQYLTIDADGIKEEIAKRGLTRDTEGLSAAEASDLAHQESSYIAQRLTRRAMDDGKNVIWDIATSGQESMRTRLDDLDRRGYRTTGILVAEPEADGDRANRRFFEQIKSRFAAWAVYDDSGRDPVLIASSRESPREEP
jgi:hypothetical protein